MDAVSVLVRAGRRADGLESTVADAREVLPPLPYNGFRTAHDSGVRQSVGESRGLHS